MQGKLCSSRWPSLCPTTPAAPSRHWQPRQLRRSASGRPARRRSAAQLLHQPPAAQQPRAAARRRRAASDTASASAASGSFMVSAVFSASLTSTTRQHAPGAINRSTAALAAEFGTQVVSYSRNGPLAGKQLRGWVASLPVASGRSPSAVASGRSTVVAAYAGSGGSGMGGGKTVLYEYVVTFRERAELTEGEALEALETLWAMQYRLPGCMFAASGASNSKLGHASGAHCHSTSRHLWQFICKCHGARQLEAFVEPQTAHKRNAPVFCPPCARHMNFSLPSLLHEAEGLQII